MISGHLCPLQIRLWTLQLPPLEFLVPVKYYHPAALMAVKTLNQANIYPFHGNVHLHQRSHIININSLCKYICVEDLTASYSGIWNYKIHPPNCVTVGGICKTGRLSSIKQESRTHSGILGC